MADPEDCQALIAVFLFCPQDQRDFLNAAQSPAGEPVNNDRFSLDIRQTYLAAGLGAFEREVCCRKFRRKSV